MTTWYFINPCPLPLECFSAKTTGNSKRQTFSGKSGKEAQEADDCSYDAVATAYLIYIYIQDYSIPDLFNPRIIRSQDYSTPGLFHPRTIQSQD